MGIFNLEKKPIIREAVDSVIGAQAKFKGEVSTSGSININGEFEGKLIADGEVIISTGSRVVGDVSAGTVIVSGRVDGNITAIHALEITKSGRVHGDLKGGRILIEEGSSYSGKVKIEPEEEAEAKEEAAPEPKPLFQES